MTAPGGGSSRPIPWRQIFVTLAKEYGWTADEIGRLTFAQVWVYWRQPADEGQTVRLGLGEAMALVAGRRQQERAWIDRQLKSAAPPEARRP